MTSEPDPQANGNLTYSSNMAKSRTLAHPRSTPSQPAQQILTTTVLSAILSKKKRLSRFANKTKAKTKRLFHVDGAKENDRFLDGWKGIMEDIDNDPAFNPSHIPDHGNASPKGGVSKTKEALQFIKSVARPIQAIKNKVTRTTAGQLSNVERPYLSKKNDVEFLEAHDNLKRVESTGSLTLGTSDEEQESILDSHRDKVREMEAHRESLRVAWTTKRHVRRVRVVPKRHVKIPKDEYFVERSPHGDRVRYDWLSWLGNNLLYYTQDFSSQYVDDFDELPFDIESSRHHIERLVIASSPWQSWAMKVRTVYRWEDPKITGKWLALYILLWYTRHVMGFLWLYIIYIVLKNRVHPTSVSSLRDSMKRALDSQEKAYKFGEIIDKHGRHDWLEPVMEDLGAYVQLQLGDIANMLEVFANFYHWKSPRKTAASLCFFASCLLVSLFADMAFCMQIVWFIAGGSFFLCWPISSHYPKYRYLVSPFKWVFWDIPTDAEWSFQYLRRHAQLTREQLIEQKTEQGHFNEIANPATDEQQRTGRFTSVPKINIDGDVPDTNNDSDDEGWHTASSATSVLEASDIRSFRACWEGSPGRLVVFSKGIRFVRTTTTTLKKKEKKKQELWRRDFLELAEMGKFKKRSAAAPRIVSSSSSCSDRLEIRCVDGSEIELAGMAERDEAFNSIVGFSGLQWQCLQERDMRGGS